jgi:hypothetical protein
MCCSPSCDQEIACCAEGQRGPQGGSFFLGEAGSRGDAGRLGARDNRMEICWRRSGRATCDRLRFRGQGRRAFCAASTTMTKPAGFRAGSDAALVVRRRAARRFGRTAIVVARKVLDAAAGAAARHSEQAAGPRLYVFDPLAVVAVVARTREYGEQPQRHRQRHPHPHDADPTAFTSPVHWLRSALAFLPFGWKFGLEERDCHCPTCR